MSKFLQTVCAAGFLLGLQLPLSAQSLPIAFYDPLGNNLVQVTDVASADGLIHTINKLSLTSLEHLTYNPTTGTTVRSLVTIPDGYELALGIAAKMDLEAKGTVALTLVNRVTGRFRVALYQNFDMTAPTLLSALDAQVFAMSASGRMVGNVSGFAGELLSSGGFVPLVGQIDGTALTAFDAASGFGYAGAITAPDGVLRSFYMDGRGVIDPFNSLAYEAAFIGTCSRFASFCYGNVTDPILGQQMWGVDMITGALTPFLMGGESFFAGNFSGALEDGTVFGNASFGPWAANIANPTMVMALLDYCSLNYPGLDCSLYEWVNGVSEYRDPLTGEYRFNLPGEGSFVLSNARMNPPIYAQQTITPEPGTIALLGSGLFVLAALGRRNKRRVDNKPIDAQSFSRFVG